MQPQALVPTAARRAFRPPQAVWQDIAEIAGRPLSRATTLPREAYLDDAFFEEEADAVLRSDWLSVAHVSQIPDKGSYVALDLLGEPLVAIRGDDGQVRVLSRVCPHRAMDILPDGFAYAREGRLNHLVCPYHRWSFASDGSLKGCAEMQRAEGFDKADWRLAEVRSAIWQGFVFVNLSGTAPPLEEQYAEFGRRIAPWNCAELKVAIALEWDCPFNWKVMVENWIESYHHLGIHHRTLNTMMPAQLTWTEPEHPHLIHCHLPFKPEVAAQARAGQLPPGFAALKGLPDAAQVEWGLFVGQPCFMFLTMADRVLWYRLQPVSAERCRLLTTTLISAEAFEAEGFAETLAAETKMLSDFHLEDMEVNTAVQHGLRSAHVVRGRLSHLEEPVWHIQRHLARRHQAHAAVPVS
ncbi:aromatic ring-hydroxylating oxygenase subunit alpha [Zavarzinia sp. CC-PAN008]|uniref:aromatic ring-hydroxylating oxygenase subunit alpha n=1 Tax=Zavarzinia sp. CC-PAN008 TaxID=3243332 RepID=UPI003F743E2E